MASERLKIFLAGFSLGVLTLYLIKSHLKFGEFSAAHGDLALEKRMDRLERMFVRSNNIELGKVNI